ncbi:hypothetical protein [Pseudobacteroides cellulosolvens]|uniref:Uncharacterized protein n=1 Tax=Pseudobacteroides cellulosolvens ATCC 35603 = DSM 2933 TaxID=398512 RepID=A0A0L6JVI5_9FIRM|nr:hypothetical protein [Pseudobacteroides cellulosolvens]KNY29838.1 hypothetical protein Bccel_5115 [Pseudobacteroides cellulosolvens ATCC 35603 = DSM 2933]
MDIFQGVEKTNLSIDYHIEQLISIFGFEIIYDPSDGYIILQTPSGEYEIEASGIEDLRNSTCSFIKYKLQEIIEKSRKIGK